jgi:hypothetical protein
MFNNITGCKGTGCKRTKRMEEQQQKTGKMMTGRLELASVATKCRSKSSGGLATMKQIKVQCEGTKGKQEHNCWGGPAN